MKQIAFGVMLLGIALLIAPLRQAAQSNTITATATNEANYRNQPSIEGDLLGQMVIGTPYPVVGRSEFFPWLLLGDPVSLQPIGWVFRDIVTVNGELFTVPFSTLIVDGNAAPLLPTTAPATGAVSPAQASVTPTLGAAATTVAPSATPIFNVAGSVQGEVNVRYGPGVDYARVGVAQAGDRFQITGYHTQFPWVRIRYEASPTGEAWISESLLQIEGDIFSTDAVTATVLNLPTLTPTPSVIQSSRNLGDNAAPLSPEFAALGNQLFEGILARGFDPQTSRFASLFVLDLQTNEAITFGNEIAYRGTSVNKISILARLYGTLPQPPDEFLATDIANTMICSENSATNRLLSTIGAGDEWIGAEEVTDMMTTLGLDSSFLLAPYTVDPENPPLPPAPIPVPETGVDQRIAAPEPYNQVTVDDLGWLLASMYQCAYEESGPLLENYPGLYEPRECRQMIHVMASNTVDGLLKAGVPAETRVAHKHGWVSDTHSNAGIFFTPGGDYVVSMALHSAQIDATGNRYLAFPESLPVLAETSRSIYNYFNPEVPMPAIREGFIPDAPTCNFRGDPLVADLQQSIWDQ